MKQYMNVNGLYYTVTAMFTDIDKANEYLANNVGEGVLSVSGELIYIAKLNDKGIKYIS